MNLAFFNQCFLRSNKKDKNNKEEEEEKNTSVGVDCHWWTCICSTYDIDEEMKKVKGKRSSNKEKDQHESKHDKPQEEKTDEKKPTENKLLVSWVVLEVQSPCRCSECKKKLWKTVTDVEGLEGTEVNRGSGRILVKGAAINVMALADKLRKNLKRDVRILSHSNQDIREERAEPIFDYGTNPDPVGSTYSWENYFYRMPIPSAPPLS